MEDSKREEFMQQSNLLRAELKIWEKDFAAANEGRKASREDIKKHPDIAAKYKKYNRVRDILAGKVSGDPKIENQQTPQKRKHDGAGHGVSKRQQIAITPSKGALRPWEVDPYDSPSVVRNLFTPSKKVLGPTPQKDGRVLGLFDLISDDGIVASPSKRNNNAPAALQIPVHATPRKSKTLDQEILKPNRTPSSAGRRHMLDAFATPLKNKTSNTPGGKTPSSVSKLHFTTPSFLRRDSQRIQLSTVEENQEGEASPEMVRVPRKPLVRGLSSMLAGLRKMADDAADDDLEALREMEMEEMGVNKPGPNPSLKVTKLEESVLIADSQPGFPLGGFDDEAMYDSEPEVAKGPDGQPLRVYKKKGQKRTTRRVNMKPNRSKPAPIPEATEEESEDELAGEAVLETQLDETAGFAESARNFDSDSQSEYTASDGGTRYRRPNQSKTKNKSLNKDGKIKTAARKVNAMAHQNFKRLKLRNSGAKGGAAHNSRFRRKK